MGEVGSGENGNWQRQQQAYRPEARKSTGLLKNQRTSMAVAKRARGSAIWDEAGDVSRVKLCKLYVTEGF